MYEIDEEVFKNQLQCFLKRYMKENDLTQRELATLTNLSESTIKNFCNKKAMPTLDVFYNIMISLHVNLFLEFKLPTSECIQYMNQESMKKIIDEDLHTLEMIRKEIQ